MQPITDGSTKSENSKHRTEDCAKDGGEEFFTEIHRVRTTNL